jgi:hypothetical protein
MFWDCFFFFSFIFLKEFFWFCGGGGGGGVGLEDVFLGLGKLARIEALHSVRVVCLLVCLLEESDERASCGSNRQDGGAAVSAHVV